MTDPAAMGILALLSLLSQQQRSEPPPQGPPGPPGPPAPYAGPGAMPAPAPAPMLPPGVGPPLPPWPAAPVPASLPPFPGPGWIPDTPVTPAVVARAQYWNPLLWDYPSKSIRKPYAQEQLGGQWVTFAAAWHPGDKGPQTYMSTEAWRLATAPPVALPSATPGPVPTVPPYPGAPPAAPPAPADVPAGPPLGLMLPPAPIGPSPGTGAWQTNKQFITRYQTSLTYLAHVLGHPAWDTGGIDGRFGPKTGAAVTAFQRDNHLTPIDGKVGTVTSSAIDALVGARGAAPPIPVSVGPPAAPAHAPIPSPIPYASPAPSAMPASGPQLRVGPAPGVGAWQTNKAFIGRYQTALTYLAHVLGHPAWDTGGVDGRFGPKTQAGVSAFQRDNGLSPVDGKVGNATASAIDALLAANPAAAA